MNQPMRKIEVDEATARALEKRAAESGTSVGMLVSELLLRERHPATISDKELAELDRQWARIQAGEETTVPHEEVEKWLETWGKPGSKPWPVE